MVYLKNNRMILPHISMAIPNDIYIDTNPPACSIEGIEFISKSPHFRLSISAYDENISQALKNFGDDTVFTKYETVNINGISGLFIKSDSSGLNYAEILLDIDKDNCFSLSISTENNVDDILSQESIKSLITSIELVDNN